MPFLGHHSPGGNKRYTPVRLDVWNGPKPVRIYDVGQEMDPRRRYATLDSVMDGGI
jgi:hypothetical protein